MCTRTMACAAALLVFLSPLTAAAFPQASDVLLDFGASYAAPDGSQCTHRGVDAALDPGSSVEAPVAGTIRFAGRVPGPHGGTIGAVTIEAAQGKVTLLPIGDIRVSKGDSVTQGDNLGLVSSEGDPSSAAPHVHISLRRGDLYVDPTPLLAVAPTPAENPIESPEPVVAPTPSTDAVPVKAPAPVAAPGAAALAPTVTTPAPATAPAAALTPLPQSSAPVPSAGTASRAVMAATTMGEGVSVAPSSVAVATGVQGPSFVTQPLPATADVSSSERLSRILLQAGRGSAAWLRSTGSTGPVAICAALFACACLLGKRAFERRVASNPPVSDRLGRLLQQLRAGDTLRGLTSCSGPLPSQSQSRSAQGR